MAHNNDWLVHGDFHHHNILRHGDRFIAIGPKPYLAQREYDVPTFLWNPTGNEMTDRGRTEARIAAFVAAGLDDRRIRAWTVIRASYLRPQLADPIRRLMQESHRRVPATGWGTGVARHTVNWNAMHARPRELSNDAS